MPSIPTIGINLVVVSSQEEILHVEEEHVHKQTYMLIKTMHEGGDSHNEIQRDEEV